MKLLILTAALLFAGCAEPIVRAGNQCGVIYSNGVSAWVPCSEKNKESQ